jgi:hypothetical protein
VVAQLLEGMVVADAQHLAAATPTVVVTAAHAVE